jgi:hypothetical protein
MLGQEKMYFCGNETRIAYRSPVCQLTGFMVLEKKSWDKEPSGGP